jgi:hypothetical protein
MKVNEYLRDAHSPLGDLGANVDIDTAMKVADEIRAILLRCCLEAVTYDNDCDHDQLGAAWTHLNAPERAAWKELVRCGHAHQR